MKALILAAGQGTRLRPLTEDRPKVLVPVRGKSILERQLETFKKEGVSDLNIVTGYLNETLGDFPGAIFHNAEYANSNMVYSMSAAQSIFDGSGDVIVSYGDIVYTADVLKALMQSESDICVVADCQWLKLWQLRMENPLEDAESFICRNGNEIIELGKPITNYEQAQAQFIGLFKISAQYAPQFLTYYQGMLAQDGAKRHLYMTDYLQWLVDNQKVNAMACNVEGGWFEVDTIEDWNLYENQVNDTHISKVLND